MAPPAPAAAKHRQDHEEEDDPPEDERKDRPAVVAALLLLSGSPLYAQAPSPPADAARLDALKRVAAADVESMRVMTQQMTDQVFSFGELGFQEVETSKYLTGVLEQHGFRVERGVAGIPTAWTARWGSGKPVIALGSDIDDIPQASQKPGVAYRDPIVEGAPGHGEGHNSGLPLQITAAIALKRVMEREKLPGTLLLWPGVAEELLAGKAYLVRAGVFKDVDACIFAHVSDGFGVRWGEATASSGLVSIEYTFTGESAHSAGAPWRGRSALDAVELMNVGWNFRREHLRLQHRSHYVITNGGDQPNVVPRRASVWYFLRETDAARIAELRTIADRMAQGAAMMTDTEVTSRVIGSAWPQHFNRPIAETMYTNITAVGLPQWDAADQTLARAVQKELGQPERGLTMAIGPLTGSVTADDNYGGGSDDIGDVSWTVPTVTIRYPSNIPGLPGHHWANAIASATPIAHKGATAGAKAVAMTGIDLLLRPELVAQAWDYFRTVQTKSLTYTPLIAPTDVPQTSMNAKTMETYRPALSKFYFDPTKYKTYLEQLGISYPTIRSGPTPNLQGPTPKENRE
jgi:aminobenzoyl-glutamate utilization protein B